MAAQIPAGAQDKGPEPAPMYALGDQTLAANASLFLPLFFLSYQPAMTTTNLTPGGALNLQWQAYVSGSWRVGVELGFAFAFSPNLNPLIQVPILAKATYIFGFYPFEVPISLGAGINIVKYSDQSTVDPLLKPEVGFYWIFSSSWSFGIGAGYMFDFMFASDAAKSRIGNFLDITISALYHY